MRHAFTLLEPAPPDSLPRYKLSCKVFDPLFLSAAKTSARAGETSPNSPKNMCSTLSPIIVLARAGPALTRMANYIRVLKNAATFKKYSSGWFNSAPPKTSLSTHIRISEPINSLNSLKPSAHKLLLRVVKSTSKIS